MVTINLEAMVYFCIFALFIIFVTALLDYDGNKTVSWIVSSIGFAVCLTCLMY